MIFLGAYLAGTAIRAVSELATSEFRCNLGGTDKLAQHIFKDTIPTLGIIGGLNTAVLRNRYDFKVILAVTLIQLAVIEVGTYLLNRGFLAEIKEGQVEVQEGQMEMQQEKVKSILSQPDVAVAVHQGGRGYFEDRHVAANISIEDYPDAKLLLVFDGHRGHRASEQSSEQITDLMSKYLEHYVGGKESYTKADVLNAIKASFADLRSSFEEQKLEDGTTCTGVLLFDGHIWSINLGDSRTIFVSEPGANNVNPVMNFTNDAKPNKQRFQKHTEKYGGSVKKDKKSVFRVRAKSAGKRMLAMGAALGDSSFGNTLSRRPKVICFEPKPHTRGGVIMVASDGAYDYADSATFAELIRESQSTGASLQSTAQALVEPVKYRTYRGGKPDNTTILLHSVTEESLRASSGKMVQSEPSESSKPRRIALLANAPQDVHELVEKYNITSYEDLKDREQQIYIRRSIEAKAVHSEKVVHQLDAGPVAANPKQDLDVRPVAANPEVEVEDKGLTLEEAARIRAYRAYSLEEAVKSSEKQEAYLSKTKLDEKRKDKTVIKGVVLDELRASGAYV